MYVCVCQFLVAITCSPPFWKKGVWVRGIRLASRTHGRGSHLKLIWAHLWKRQSCTHTQRLGFVMALWVSFKWKGENQFFFFKFDNAGTLHFNYKTICVFLSICVFRVCACVVQRWGPLGLSCVWRADLGCPDSVLTFASGGVLTGSSLDLATCGPTWAAFLPFGHDPSDLRGLSCMACTVYSVYLYIVRWSHMGDIQQSYVTYRFVMWLVVTMHTGAQQLLR